MAVISTKAIVFSAIKYGDADLIVKCFTREEGVKSYLVRGVLKSKKGKLKPAYFQALTQLNIVANHNQKNTLNFIKEASIVYPYESVHTSVVKQTIMMFLSEVLSSIVQEEELNESLYDYIESALVWFDLNSDISNFHLAFLMKLTQFLGFYPDVSAEHRPVFNLLEGKFSYSINEKLSISGTELQSFKKVIGVSFDEISSIPFYKKERQFILKTIIQYYELHLNGFRSPKSLIVLDSVFN